MQLAFPAPAPSRWKNYTRFQGKWRPVPVKKRVKTKNRDNYQV
jgi:hypothetical protein